MPRRSLLPCLLTLPEFIVVDQQIHAAGGGIDPDMVAFAGRGLERLALWTVDLDDSSGRAKIVHSISDASIRHDRVTRAEDDFSVGRIRITVILRNRCPCYFPATPDDLTACDKRTDNDGG